MTSSSMSTPRFSEPGYPRGGLHGQIVHAIGRQILNGVIRPGDLLPTQPGLPASRTVLREVICVADTRLRRG
jgi:DNA-binding FadR family transcriptional regulator